jgi:hypothetical protein
MSITYTPTTNFGSKDNLPANDPNKVIVGGEFTFEFNAIQAAFALAAPTSNPTFTGTATFGTLNAGTTTVGTFTSTGIDDNATSTAITIDSAEDVGIGDTDPTSKLSVQSGNSSRPIAARSTTTGAFVAFTDATTTSLGHVKVGAEADNLALFAGAQARMKVFSGGNVGIGTDSPIAGSKLTVKDGFISVDTAGVETMRMQSATGEGRVASSDDLVFRAGGTSSVSSDRMRITAAGNVGIGEAAPSGRLHVKTANSGASAPSGSGDDLVLEGSGNTGITIQTPNTSRGSVFFQDPQSTAAGYLQYDHSLNAMTLGSSGVARMTIDTNGNVGIGTTAPTLPLTVTANTGGGPQIGITAGVADVDGVIGFPLAGASKASIITNKQLAFHTGVTDNTSGEVMRLTSGGNVGIGTTNPTYPLVVSNGNGGTEFEPGDTVCKMFTYNRTTSLYADNQMGGKAIIFTSGTTANTERMRIDASGNVGIGTDNPQTSLHITQTSDSSADGIRLSRSNELATYTQWVEGSTFNIGYANPSTADPSSAALTINSSGNVGIGADAPAKNLEVAGTAPTIRITDTQQKSWTKGDAIGQLEWYTEDQSASGARVAASIDIVASNTAVQPYADMVFSLSGLSTTEQPIMTLANTGNVGIGEIAPARTLHVGDAMRLEPTSTPASPSAGDLYFDSTTNKLRCYDGTLWQDCF